MADVCERCKQWRKEQYWNEIPTNKHHFFKIMLGDFRNRLRIPRKFVDKFNGELLKKVTLRSPNGNTWETELVDIGEDLVFQNGWETFARDHSLNDGDFLVFWYFERSSFDVLMFDATGCEKESSYFVSTSAKDCCSIREKRNHQFTNMDDDMQKEQIFSESSSEGIEREEFTLRKRVSDHTRKRRQWKFVEREDEDQTDDDDDDFENMDDEEEPERLYGKNKKQRVENGSGKNERREKGKGKVIVPENASSSEDEQTTRRKNVTFLNKCRRNKKITGSGTVKWKNDGITKKYPKYYKSSRRAITEEDKSRAYDLAIRHPTMQPRCNITMQPSSVCHGFIQTIPRKWAKSYLPHESHEIKLRVPPGRKTWGVHYNYRELQCTLHKGWPKFVLDNNVEEHDVCVFELVHKSEKMTLMDVHIYRAVEKITPLEVVTKL